jgi:hypothetical protein
MNNYIPSINESINAKNTSINDLCETFIVNEYYQRLASSSHTIMMGPRGSGKTTLMRMLEVRSLEVWDKDQAEIFRSKISFSGVFIPTDRLWKTQYENTAGKLNNQIDKDVLSSQFIYHILEQLAQAVSFRTSRTIEVKNNFRHVQIDKLEESVLVDELSEIWCVKPRIKSLKSLIVSIAVKKHDVSKYINNIAFKKIKSDAPEVVKSDISDILSTSISIINTYLDESGEKWAFLFDELELAPDEIIQPLIDSMRGGHQDIILKLALSPYHKGVKITASPESSMKNQDLSFIDLTEISETEGLKFAKELCTNLFIKKGIFTSVERCFESPEELNIDEVFDSLCEKDPSFKQYLEDKNVYGIKYEHAGNKQSQLRKIKFISYLRDYVKRDSKRFKARRRAADYYAGFNNVCKATEYNPRMLIGIMNMFIPIIKDRKKVTIGEQIQGIQNYFESFRSLLSTIAIDSSDPDINNIYDLVEKIAKFFKSEIYGPEFNSEPKAALVMDMKTNPDFREAIGFALNSGAMITIKNSRDGNNELTNEGVRSCRLSYLFSHHFGLLLTKQKTINLNELLKMSKFIGNSISVVRLYSKDNEKQIRLDLK